MIIPNPKNLSKVTTAQVIMGQEGADAGDPWAETSQANDGDFILPCLKQLWS